MVAQAGASSRWQQLLSVLGNGELLGKAQDEAWHPAATAACVAIDALLPIRVRPGHVALCRMHPLSRSWPPLRRCLDAWGRRRGRGPMTPAALLSVDPAPALVAPGRPAGFAGERMHRLGACPPTPGCPRHGARALLVHCNALTRNHPSSFLRQCSRSCAGPPCASPPCAARLRRSQRRRPRRRRTTSRRNCSRRPRRRHRCCSCCRRPSAPSRRATPGACLR